jgi:Putative auto-transporter adhesin, head GIN domain
MSIPALPSDPTNAGRRFTPARIALLVVLVAAGAFFVARQDGASPRLSFTDAVRGSGVPATQARTVPSFGAIDLTGSSSITVHVGSRQTVIVHADDNLINRVTTDVRDGVLVVSERGSFSSNLPMSVDVTVPTLAAARLTGSGTIAAEGVTGRTFTAEVPGSGLLTVSGTVARLNAILAGSGNMQLGGLTARSVTATVPGSGHIDVHATYTLDASILGNGQIVYSGHPKTVNQIVNGSGAILRG